MRNFYAGKFAAEKERSKEYPVKITGTHLGIFVMITYFILNIWIDGSKVYEKESEDSVSERSDRKRQEP